MVSVEYGQEPRANPPGALGWEHYHSATGSGVLEFQENAHRSPVTTPCVACAGELLQMRQSREDWTIGNAQRKANVYMEMIDES